MRAGKSISRTAPPTFKDTPSEPTTSRTRPCQASTASRRRRPRLCPGGTEAGGAGHSRREQPPRVHGNAAHEIEVASAVGGDEMHAFAADEIDGCTFVISEQGVGSLVVGYRNHRPARLGRLDDGKRHEGSPA